MSGVFTNRLGRMKSAVSCDTEVRNSSSSCFVLRQVKYEYDCWKPTIASACIIAGRVNASARKTMPGSSAFTAAISRSQNVSGLVWGLSTRKMRTPCLIQCRTIRSTSSKRPWGSSSKLTG